MKTETIQISIILPVFSETSSLVQTVADIKTVISPDCLKEIIIIVSPKSNKESVEICERLAIQDPFIHYYIQQNNPGVGWAFREAFEKVQGTHVLMMACDGETDPKVIPLMIEKAKLTRCDIVISNRWIQGGGFQGYGYLRMIFNYIFQRIIGLLYRSAISDYTYAYRLYKIETLKGCSWRETRHPFLLESLLRPLKKGFTVEQVPAVWHPRTEGKSKNTILQNFYYFRTALKIYFER